MSCRRRHILYRKMMDVLFINDWHSNNLKLIRFTSYSEYMNVPFKIVYSTFNLKTNDDLFIFISLNVFLIGAYLYNILLFVCISIDFGDLIIIITSITRKITGVPTNVLAKVPYMDRNNL